MSLKELVSQINFMPEKGQGGSGGSRQESSTEGQTIEVGTKTHGGRKVTVVIQRDKEGGLGTVKEIRPKNDK